MSLIPQIVEVINEELAKSEFSDISVSESDFVEDGKSIRLADLRNNWCSTILERAVPDLRRSCDPFYHFRESAEKILSILRWKAVQAWNLPCHADNDNHEITRFMNLFGGRGWEAPEDRPWFEGSVNRLEDWRASIHIFCSSKHVSPYLWRTYGGEHAGGYLELEMREVDSSEGSEIQPMYEFRPVVYDDGNRFGFLRRIDNRVREIASDAVVFSNVLRFAKHYKDSAYCDEDEVRLSFDQKYTNWVYGRNLFDEMGVTYYEGHTNPNVTYVGGAQPGHLHIPLLDRKESRFEREPLANLLVVQSPYFALTLKRVVCGHLMSDKDREAIREICARNFPNAIVEFEA